MILVLLGLSAIAGLANLAVAIIFLIQLFKAKGVGHGIFGLICGLYTLIWGWQNADALDAQNPPVAGFTYHKLIRIWLGLVGVSILIQVLSNVLAVSMAR